MRDLEHMQPLRDEHHELLPQLVALRDVALRLAREDPGRGALAASPEVARILCFLRDDVATHMRAEEAALYPAVDRALGSPVLTMAMVADHREIERLIASVSAAVEGGDSCEVQAHLVALSSLLLLHLRKEEEVVLPLLEGRLPQSEAAALFARMRALEHSRVP